MRVRITRPELFLLQHRQNIARRIFEPGDRRATVVMNPFFVCLNFPFILLKLDPVVFEFGYRLLNVGAHKI